MNEENKKKNMNDMKKWV